MIDLKHEDNLAKLLSDMSPQEYGSLMNKVDRSKWEAIPTPRNSKYNLFSTSHVKQKK